MTPILCCLLKSPFLQDTPRFVAGYIPSFAHKNPKFCWPPVNVRTNVENPPFAVDNFRTRRNHGFFHIFPYVYTVSPQLFTAFCSRMYLKMGIIPILNAGRSFFWDNAAAYQWLLWPTIIYYPSDFSTDFSRCSYIFPGFSNFFPDFSRFSSYFLLKIPGLWTCRSIQRFSRQLRDLCRQVLRGICRHGIVRRAKGGTSATAKGR